MSALQNRIISARTLIAGSGAANDVRAVSDYYLGSGDKCGPQTITGESGREENLEKFLILWNNLTLDLSLTIPGWTQNVDYARTENTDETGTRFKAHKTCNFKNQMHLRFDSSTGIYTPIIAGYYHVCSYARYTFFLIRKNQ